MSATQKRQMALALGVERPSDTDNHLELAAGTAHLKVSAPYPARAFAGAPLVPRSL